MRREDIDKMNEEIRKRVTGCSLTETTILKVGGPKQGISCRLPSGDVCVTFYPNDYQPLLDSGETPEAIGRYLASEIEKNRLTVPQFPQTAEEFKKGLYIQLVNADVNRELLKDAVHDSWEDTAVLARYKIAETKDELLSFVVTKDNMGQFQLSQGEIMEAAYRNTREQPFHLKSMKETMQELMLEQGTPAELVSALLSGMDNSMYILTNQRKVYGASALMCPQALENAYQVLGEPYYALPSSTHELILVRESYGLTPDELRQMVKEVNYTTVQAKDLLSNRVFHYDGRKLSTVQEKEQVMEAVKHNKLIH